MADLKQIGSALLQLIEGDGLIAFGPALGTFLAAEASAAGDPIKVGAAYIKLQGDLVAAAPTALGGLEAQLATILSQKLAAKQSSAQAQVQGALAALSGQTVSVAAGSK